MRLDDNKPHKDWDKMSLSDRQLLLHMIEATPKRSPYSSDNDYNYYPSRLWSFSSIVIIIVMFGIFIASSFFTEF